MAAGPFHFGRARDLPAWAVRAPPHLAGGLAGRTHEGRQVRLGGEPRRVLDLEDPPGLGGGLAVMG